MSSRLHLVLLSVVAGSLLAFAGCSTTVPVVTTPRVIISKPSEDWIQTELFFNLARADGTRVTDTQWQGFADECSANFPEGVTILPAMGQYRETQGRTISDYREPSHVVIIAYPKTDPFAEVRIKGLCRSYLSFYNKQAAVLRIDTPVRASLTLSQEEAPASRTAASAQ